MAWAESMSLSGERASVVPLSRAHSKDLQDAAADGALHELWFTTVPAPDAMDDEIANRLKLQDAGSWLPFAVIDNDTGKAVGMTKLAALKPAEAG